MPHCDECGHHHLGICQCGCRKVVCAYCKHQHGKKFKDGRCQFCECKKFTPYHKESQEEE